MKHIVFLANPTSPHVAQWVSLIDKETKITIIHIPTNGNNLVDATNVVTHSPLPKFFSRLPKLLNYLALGAWLRFKKNYSSIHAHNTSGYGFAARISGIQYGITTYGTEIYQIPQKSFPYKILINSILKNAMFVTTTSKSMNAALSKYTNCSTHKIYSFSLGVRNEFILDTSKKSMNFPRCWIANRRIHPLYDTHILIEAFERFLQDGGKGELYLLQGQAETGYLDVIKSRISTIDNIHLIEKFLTPREMANTLHKMDFAISIPKSDQLSSAILEAAACGAIPILRDLAAYTPLSEIAITVDRKLDLSDALLQSIHFSSQISKANLKNMSAFCQNTIKTRYSTKNAYEQYMNILDLL